MAFWVFLFWQCGIGCCNLILSLSLSDSLSFHFLKLCPFLNWFQTYKRLHWKKRECPSKGSLCKYWGTGTVGITVNHETWCSSGLSMLGLWGEIESKVRTVTHTHTYTLSLIPEEKVSHTKWGGERGGRGCKVRAGRTGCNSHTCQWVSKEEVQAKGSPGNLFSCSLVSRKWYGQGAQ